MAGCGEISGVTKFKGGFWPRKVNPVSGSRMLAAKFGRNMAEFAQQALGHNSKAVHRAYILVVTAANVADITWTTELLHG